MHYKVITFTIFGEQTVAEVEAKNMSEVAKKYRYCIVDRDGKYGRYYKGKKVTTKPTEFKIWRDGKQAWLLTTTVSTGHKIQEVHFDNRYMKEQKEKVKKIEPIKNPLLDTAKKVSWDFAELDDALKQQFLEYKAALEKQKEDSTSAKSAKPLKQQSPITVSIVGTKGIVDGWTPKKISNESVTNAINEVTETLGNTDKSSGKDNANDSDVKEWYYGINPYLSNQKNFMKTGERKNQRLQSEE